MAERHAGTCFCGGHLMTEHPALGFTDVPAAFLPTLDFRPMVHLNDAEAVLPVVVSRPEREKG